MATLEALQQCHLQPWSDLHLKGAKQDLSQKTFTSFQTFRHFGTVQISCRTHEACKPGVIDACELDPRPSWGRLCVDSHALGAICVQGAASSSHCCCTDGGCGSPRDCAASMPAACQAVLAPLAAAFLLCIPLAPGGLPHTAGRPAPHGTAFIYFLHIQNHVDATSAKVKQHPL